MRVLYDDALLRIQSQRPDDRELAEKALRWVAYTYEPLNVYALQEAVAIESGQTDFDDEALTAIGWILNACAGLLIHDEENQIVRLVHETAQEYFVAMQESNFPKAHTDIASCCITYLSYMCFQHAQGSKDSADGGIETLSNLSDDEAESFKDSADDEIEDPTNLSGAETKGSSDLSDDSTDTSTSPNQFYLLPYASRFWAQHAKANGDAELSSQVHQFLARDLRIFLDSAPIPYRARTSLSTRKLKTHSGVNVAAFFGLCDELEAFIKDADDSNALIRDLKTLHFAVQGNQDTAVNLLLDHGADIDQRNRHGLTPLLLAIESESLEAATALVGRGADSMAVSARRFENLTPIASIRADCPTPYLELLLRAGATIRTEDLFDKTPLTETLLERNDIDTARMLFENYASCEPKRTNIPSEALLYAPLFDCMEIIEMLLDHGADVNSKDYIKSTALHKASEYGKLAILKLLLGRGAEIDAEDSEGVTSLSFAASRGHDDCVLTLLHHNANVNTQDEYGITPLHGASASCSLTTTEELVKHCAAIDARSRSIFTLMGNRSWFKGYPPLGFEDLLRIIQEPTVHHPIGTENVPEVLYQIITACPFEDPWKLRSLLSSWKDKPEIGVCKAGVTALDLAILRKHDGIVCLLKPLTKHSIGSDSILFENYLDLLEVSSVEELEKELDWMIKIRLKKLFNSVEESCSSEEGPQKPARTWMRVKEKLSAMESEVESEVKSED